MSKKRSKKKKPKKLKKILSHKIIAVFKDNSTLTLNYKQVSAALDIHDAPTRKLIYTILNELAREEQLQEVSRGKFHYIQRQVIITGVMDANRSGGGYVVSDDIDDDVFIAARHMNQSLHGDLVKVSLFLKGKRRRPEGEVVEVMEQANRLFVGTVEVQPKFAFLIPDNPNIRTDIFIPGGKVNGAKTGQKAIAKIADWPDGAQNPIGEIVEVLGDPGEHQTEMNAIMVEYELPRTFPEHVEQDAGKIPLELDEDEIARRKDIRDILTFTIDPVDAKDFDDALSIRTLDNGNTEVGVHIADVSHYVKPGGIIDEEAINRATSVYLVDRVIPMLPEVLSNQVCSLRPNEDKFTFSAIFELNAEAEIQNEWFGRTVIHSDRRFTYEEAQERLETGEGDLVEELKTLDTLAKKLRKARMKYGSIEFSSIEVKFKLDEKGNPMSVFQKVTKDSNQLIEDFMLLANRRVAAFIGQRKANEVVKPFIYRVHDEPDLEKLNTLSLFVKQFDYDVRFTGKNISENLNQMLAHFKGTNEQQMVEQVAIRSMAKAVYATENVGHYGLGFEYYTHFTSPIRRYPDLEVHRLLEHYLSGGKGPETNALDLVCKHSSLQEKRAAEAERASIKYMQVKFMMDKIGLEFEGVISGLTEWGMYVELVENKVEGMISLRSLVDDYYVFDTEKYRVTGTNSGNSFYLGDRLTIRVMSADLQKKQLDFRLVPEGEDEEFFIDDANFDD